MANHSVLIEHTLRSKLNGVTNRAYTYTGQGLQHKHEFKAVERANIDEEMAQEQQELNTKKLKPENFKSAMKYELAVKQQER